MPFITTIYDKYVLNMAKDGTYADHIAVILMNQILCVKIYLHQETAIIALFSGSEAIVFKLLCAVCSILHWTDLDLQWTTFCTISADCIVHKNMCRLIF